jgi:choline-sulfatase
LIVASFLSPHDITLYRLLANLSGAFASDVEDVVPRDLFDPVRFQQMRHDDLTTKPGCQASYPMWMQPVADRERYSRFYYQLHKNVDEQMMVAYQALRNSRFRDDTIVIFTPDHGDLLGSHADMHQKWYTAYHEAIRVPRARGL